MEDIVTQKKLLRTRIRALRTHMRIEEVKQRSQDISARLLSLPEFKSATTIMLYRALPGEVDLDDCFSSLWQQGRVTAVPKVEAGEILPFSVKHLEQDFVTGSFGIQEPGPAQPRVEFEAIQIVLVPGCVFDLSGRRLGWGKGFYDRFLSRLPAETLSIAVGWEQQVVDRVPTEPHDRAVKMLMTELGVWKFY